MILYILGGFLLAALGVLFFCKPDLIWELKESWKSYSAGDPSELYLKMTKIAGIFMTVVGAGGAVLLLILGE